MQNHSRLPQKDKNPLPPETTSREKTVFPWKRRFGSEQEVAELIRLAERDVLPWQERIAMEEARASSRIRVVVMPVR